MDNLRRGLTNQGVITETMVERSKNMKHGISRGSVLICAMVKSWKLDLIHPDGRMAINQ